MSCREHGTLDHQAIGAGLLDQLCSAGGLCRHGRNANRDARPLDGGNALRDQRFANRRLVDLLQQRIDALARRLGNLLQDAGRIGVAGLEAIQVEDGHPAEPPHLDPETDVNHPVHGGREDGDRQA